MITLAVDAMGGDAGLTVTVPGAIAFFEKAVQCAFNDGRR